MSLTAGVAGVIFGIGCQNIVADIMAGIIMTFEGAACAGDFVSYNGRYSVIQSIGVRTTKLKWFSEIMIVRNNEFKNYINMPSDDIGRVVVSLSIDMKESITRVESIIDNDLPLIRENLCEALGEEIESPRYRGVQGIENGGITLSFAVFCKGKHFGWVRRLMSRELLLMCERNGIRLAMTQIAINDFCSVPDNRPDPESAPAARRTGNTPVIYMENESSRPLQKHETGKNEGIPVMNYVYLLRCGDGTFYCGWTNNLTARVAAHNRGNGAKYTRSRLPVELVYYEEYDSRHEAMSREWHIKRMGREEKNDLVAMFAETTDTHEA